MSRRPHRGRVEGPVASLGPLSRGRASPIITPAPFQVTNRPIRWLCCCLSKFKSRPIWWLHRCLSKYKSRPIVAFQSVRVGRSGVYTVAFQSLRVSRSGGYTVAFESVRVSRFGVCAVAFQNIRVGRSGIYAVAFQSIPPIAHQALVGVLLRHSLSYPNSSNSFCHCFVLGLRH